VSYSGKIYFSGAPVVGGYVIAGTFKPGFSPSTYTYAYGDSSGNLEPMAYDRAVADGNFLPIGSGALTSFGGAFSASGTTSAVAGTPVWFFAFQDNSRDSFFQVLASSSNASWQTPTQPDGVTSFNVNTANQFIMGAPYLDGLQLTVIPFPEPSAAAIAMLGVIGAAMWKSRQARH